MQAEDRPYLHPKLREIVGYSDKHKVLLYAWDKGANKPRLEDVFFFDSAQEAILAEMCYNAPSYSNSKVTYYAEYINKGD